MVETHGELVGARPEDEGKPEVRCAMMLWLRGRFGVMGWSGLRFVGDDRDAWSVVVVRRGE